MKSRLLVLIIVLSSVIFGCNGSSDRERMEAEAQQIYIDDTLYRLSGDKATYISIDKNGDLRQIVCGSFSGPQVTSIKLYIEIKETK